MKKLNIALPAVIALAAFTFTSCNDDDTTTTPITNNGGDDYQLWIVDFEDADLDAGGVLIDSYEDGGLTFVCDYDEQYYSWSGFVVSDNNDKDTAGYDNMYSVYAAGGADGSDNFAMGYAPSDMTFATGETYVIDYICVTNSTYAYLAVKDGDDGNETPYVKGAFEDGDWFLLTITGYDASGNETGDVEFYLADYRDGKTDIVTDWTKVDLTSLGEVNKVTFSLSSTDGSEYDGVTYMNTPGYFCLDNAAYRYTAE